MTPASDPVRDLHAAVRQWTAHIPQNLPYVDLMFAFAHATRGDRERAAELVEDARRVMAVPVPEVLTDYRNFETVVAAVSSNFLFKAFKYRVDQALTGKPLAGRMPAELAAELAQISATARSGGANNSYLRAEHVIEKMRSVHRLLEPQDDVDPYRAWTKNQDALKKALFELDQLTDAGELADRARKLLADGVPGERDRNFRLTVLQDVLPLAPRVVQAFVTELLQVVPETVKAAQPEPGHPEPPDLLVRQARVLERAMWLAGYCGLREQVTPLVDAFLELVRAKADEDRLKFVGRVAGPCLQALRKLGSRDDIDRVLNPLEGEVGHGETVTERRVRFPKKPEAWAAALGVRLNLAAGWAMLGRHEKVRPVLDEARDELLRRPTGPWIPPKEYTELARAYVAAVAEAPADVAFARLTELFRDMDRRRITNTWTTAQYYSRFHLVLVEEVVFAVCGAGPDAPHVVAG